MTLAYINTPERGKSDRLLTALAAQLNQNNVRLSGVVQSNTLCTDSDLCDMDVQVLPDGPTIRISQSLGNGSRGCRLDPTALEQAVGLVSASLSGTQMPLPDLMIINKFGKHEADGRGFRPLIGDALVAEVPVLTAVNATNEAAFLEFAGEVAVRVASDLDALTAWFDALRAKENLSA